MLKIGRIVDPINIALPRSLRLGYLWSDLGEPAAGDDVRKEPLKCDAMIMHYKNILNLRILQILLWADK